MTPPVPFQHHTCSPAPGPGPGLPSGLHPAQPPHHRRLSPQRRLPSECFVSRAAQQHQRHQARPPVDSREVRAPPTTACWFCSRSESWRPSASTAQPLPGTHRHLDLPLQLSLGSFSFNSWVTWPSPSSPGQTGTRSPGPGERCWLGPISFTDDECGRKSP